MVANSRHQKRPNEVWRRRSCGACGGIFTTRETAELSTSVVVQYAHSHFEPFDRDRLFMSIYESCRHQTKALNNASALTKTALGTLLTTAQNGAVQRDAIVEIVGAMLERFDAAAAVIYKAYHKSA